MATFTVTTLDDETFEGSETGESLDGNGLSLREATGLANDTAAKGNTGDADNNGNPNYSITFVSSLSGQTITLPVGQLGLASDITIDGSVICFGAGIAPSNLCFPQKSERFPVTQS